MQPERVDMNKGLGALSGSRASTEPCSTVSALTGFDPARGVFAFGDDQWPGLAKLVEECGEVIQVVGKLMMTHGSPAHWSGNLREQLIEELADLRAATDFVDAHCFTVRERVAIETRRIAKTVKFLDWHADMDADPPPAIATEAGTAATVEQGAVHEGAGPQDIAQGPSQ